MFAPTTKLNSDKKKHEDSPEFELQKQNLKLKQESIPQPLTVD